jgi:hypothetical protein
MKLHTSHAFLGLFSALALAGCGSSGATPANSPSPAAGNTEHGHQHSDDNGHHSEPAEVPVEVPVPALEAPVTIDLMATEMAAYQRAKAVFDEQCAGCHTPDSSRKKPKKGVAHFSMATYPFDGHHRAELGESIRVAIGATDKAATMPQDDPGSIEGAELEALVAWADAFDAAAKAGVGYHATAAEGGHEHGAKHEQKSEHTKPKSKHKRKKPNYKHENKKPKS